MKFIASILLLLFLNVIQLKSQSCFEMDIIILCDYSGSVLGHEKVITDALDSFAHKFKLSETTIKIGLVIFSDNGYLICPLTGNDSLLHNRINFLKKINGDGSTNMVEGFQISLDEFEKNGRKDIKQIIVIISDGAPDDTESTSNISKQIQIQDIDIVVQEIHLIFNQFHLNFAIMNLIMKI